MALALYRKYRPRTFGEVIGQEHVTEPLSQALRSGRLHHAYLFSGPRGCGKTSSARILARSLNCAQGPTPDPCGECESCRSLSGDGPGSIDVIEIDAASHGGVDDARELRERAMFAPVSSRFKIYVIDEAHMVSSAGFNALLKLVEEPPEYVKFIFATTEPDKVLGTIKSRTHHYPFRLIAPSALRPYLEQLCVAEGVTVAPEVLPLVVRAGGGSARDTLSVLDQLIGGAGPEGVTYARAVSLLGVTDAAMIDDMVDAIAISDGAGAYATVHKLVEAGHDPRRFAADLLERLRDLMVLQQVPDAVGKGLIDGPADQIARMTAQADQCGPATLSRCADIVHNGLVEMRGTTGPRLLLELICARMLLPAADGSAGGLLQRLERLERHGPTPMVADGSSQHSAPTAPAVPRAATAPGAAASGIAAARAAAAAAAARPAAPTATQTAVPTPGPTAARTAATPSVSTAPEPPGLATNAPAPAASTPVSTVVTPTDPMPPGLERAGSEPSAIAPAEPMPHVDRDVPPASPSTTAAPPASPTVPATPVASPALSPTPAASPSVSAMPVEPPSAPATAAGQSAALVDSTPVAPAAPDADAVSADALRQAWGEVVDQINRVNKRMGALARDAVVRDLIGGDVVLTLKSQVLAQMLGAQVELVADALYEVFGQRWRVRCEIAGDQRAVPSGPVPAGPVAGGTATPPASSPAPAAPAAPAITPRVSAAPEASSPANSSAPTTPSAPVTQSAPTTPSASVTQGVPAVPGGPVIPSAPAVPSVSPEAAGSVDAAGGDWPEPARPGGGSAATEPAVPPASAPGAVFAVASSPARMSAPNTPGTGMAGAAASSPVNGGHVGSDTTVPTVGSAPAAPANYAGASTATMTAAPAANAAPPQAGPSTPNAFAPVTSAPAATGLSAARAAARAAAGRGGAAAAAPTRPAPSAPTTWADGVPLDEPPYDPEFDGPARAGAVPAQTQAVPRFDGFDPGDEPLDDIVTDSAFRQSSEEAAVQLLKEKLGAEQIGSDAP